jgi:hypothetical protein
MKMQTKYQLNKMDIAVACSVFCFILIWDIYFFYNNELSMNGHGDEPSLFEFIVGWLGIILQIVPYLIFTLFSFDFGPSLATSIFFGAVSATVVVICIHWIVRRRPRLQMTILTTFILCNLLTAKYAVRDYLKYKEHGSYEHG